MPRTVNIDDQMKLVELKRRVAEDADFTRRLADNPALVLSEFGVNVDPETEKAISSHLTVLPAGVSPAAALVSVVVSVLI